ncbi:MAG: hypothetical protein WCO13_06130 [Bacteroidota bacterium]
MKKLIVAISLVTFVLFVYTANANTVRQDKSKAAVSVTEKATKDGTHKCCAGDKKSDAKCCKGDAKKSANCSKDASKKDVKCDKSKAECAKKCSDAKK